MSSWRRLDGSAEGGAAALGKEDDTFLDEPGEVGRHGAVEHQIELHFKIAHRTTYKNEGGY